MKIDVGLSNSFGFGGTNGSMAVRRVWLGCSRARAPGRACRGDAASCRVRARGAGALGGAVTLAAWRPVPGIRAASLPEGGRWQLRLPSGWRDAGLLRWSRGRRGYAHPAALALREYGLYSQQLHLYRLAAGPEARCLASPVPAGAGRTMRSRAAAAPREANERTRSRRRTRRPRPARRQESFDLLVLKYQRKILRLLARMIRDPSEIEDVAQEAFIKAYRALLIPRRERLLHLVVSHRHQYGEKLAGLPGTPSQRAQCDRNGRR